ncbi:MAG: hypothetical protein ACRCX2_15405 [Paraclostridium sp.]
MSIQRTDKHDFILLTTANTVNEIKLNKDKLQENEAVIALLEKKLVIKIGNKLYSTQLIAEEV